LKKISQSDIILDGYSSPVDFGNSAPTSPRTETKCLSTNSRISIMENTVSSTNVYNYQKQTDSKIMAIENERVFEINKKTEIKIEETKFINPNVIIESISDKKEIICDTNKTNLINKNSRKLDFSKYSSINENKLLSSVEEDDEGFLKAEKLSLDLEKTQRDLIYRKFSCDAFLQGESKIKICKESDIALDSNLPNFFNLRKIELSNCWNTISKAKEKLEEIFIENKIDKQSFFKDPWKILTSNNLAIKYGNHVYTWKVMAPIIMANLCFGEDLPENILNNLTQQEQGYLFWKKKNQDAFKIDIKNLTNNSSNISYKNSISSLNPSSSTNSSGKDISINLNSFMNIEGINNNCIINSPTKSIESKSTDDGKMVILTEKENTNISINETTLRRQSIQYKKTYTLTSEQAKMLNLNSGRNEISFVVSNKYQGETKLNTKIFLWNYDDKIIISDLDGTITKSDVLGQVLPIFGKDWSHEGVVNLYNKVSNNGYKILYLTARALCQSDQTKNYLNKLQQGTLNKIISEFLLIIIIIFILKLYNFYC